MKQCVSVCAPGKINLSLDITGLRGDGYHEISTIMQAVSLYDTVSVSRMSGKGIFISCDRPRIPCDETNYAHIAARKFFQVTGVEETGLAIDIQKRIPAQAGLAGGSADAAGVLVGMNLLYDAHLELEALCEIGASVGADVPFCLTGGTRLAQGIGEIFTELPSLPPCFIVIAKPEQGISTPDSYRRYDARGVHTRPDTAALLADLETGDLKKFSQGMYNVLEEVADLPDIPVLRSKLLDGGALGAAMTGSGSAVFGIFDSRSLAKHAMRKLYENARSIFLVRPITHGVGVLDVREISQPRRIRN